MNQNDINKQWEIYTYKKILTKKYLPQQKKLDKNTQRIIKNKYKLWKQYFPSKYREIYK